MENSASRDNAIVLRSGSNTELMSGLSGDNAKIIAEAPGIAEALFATALGLLAAIPAVVGYNRYSSSLNSFSVRLQGFADEFSAILSRQLDERQR